MARRRIPSWVVILAFAMFAGGGIAGLAYLRARGAKTPTRACMQYAPNGAMLRARASHPLVEYGSKRSLDECDLYFRPRAAADAPIELRITRSKTHWNALLVHVAGPTQRQPGFFTEGKVQGAYVQFDEPRVSLILPAHADNEALEISFDTRVLDLPEAIEIAADIAARSR